MSPASRNVLLQIWLDQTVEVQQRIAAFELWAATHYPGDVEVLQNVDTDAELADRILRQRLDRADSSAIPALIEKLRDHKKNHWWWFHARYVWNPELTRALDEALTWRRNHVPQGWCEAIEEDWRTQEMIMHLSAGEAERLLLKHWEHLKFSSHFVQAALYVATPELCRRAEASIAEAPDRALLFTYISRNWGIRISGRAGITRKSQVLALEPYLDLIAITDLKAIADACNRMGWFDLRKRLLDARIDDHRVAWSSKGAIARFDALVEKGRRHWIDLEIRDALATGASWNEFLGALRAWYEERKTFEALRLLATALALTGSRRDLAALRIYDSIPREAAEALITDVTFAVNRRTAD